MFKMRIEGAAELAKALDKLPLRASANVMRAALRAGAEPIRRHAQSIAPRGPGAPDIADHIGISSARAKEGEAAAVKVGPVRGFAYGLPLEIGTVHTAAQPFMRPAFDAQAAAALGAINMALRASIIGSARVAQGPSESFAEEGDEPIVGGPGGGLL